MAAGERLGAMSRLLMKVLAIVAAALGVALLPSTLAGEPTSLGSSTPTHLGVVLDAETGAVVEVTGGPTVMQDAETGAVIGVTAGASVVQDAETAEIVAVLAPRR